MSVRGQRIVLLVLLISAVVPGLWAALGPRSFYDGFPGGGLHWVAADGPYNRHLVTDVGAFYLALAVVTVGAVRRPEWVRPAAAAWLAFSGPHWLYHSAHLGLYGTLDQVLNEVALAGSVLLAALLLVPAGRWAGTAAVPAGREVRS